MEERDNEQWAMEAPAPGLSSSDSHPAFNRLKGIVSDKLRDTARAMTHEEGPPNGGPLPPAFLEAASEWVNRGVDYIESIDLERLDRDIQARVRRSPGSTLLVAASVGFLVGVLLRRR
jgi:hypothetical protein